MIKYKQLIHAQALLLHENFRKAAKAENITQPAFSRSIASLEDSLGVQLFNRQKSRVSATPFGEILRKHISHMMGSILEFEREISIFKQLGVGELSVAVASFPSELSGNRALGRLIAEHPQIRCKVVSSDWYEVEKLVVERIVEIGFAEISEALNNQALKTELIGQHPFVFYCRSGHPLLKKKHPTKQDFDDFPVVLTKLPNRVTPFFPGRFFSEKNSTHISSSIEIQDLNNSRMIVLESNAISGAPPIQIRREIEENQFSVIPFYEPWMNLNYGFMHERGRLLSPAALKYMGIVKEIERGVASRNLELFAEFFPFP